MRSTRPSNHEVETGLENYCSLPWRHFLHRFALSRGQDRAAAGSRRRPQESASPELWPWLKEGKISFNARFRLEGFERDGAPFTGTAYAPTLRLALGYETPAYHGFSAFAQGEAVIVTGPADYSVPLLPSQNRPNLPAILDPKSLQMNQGYLKWTHGISDKKVAITLGRQELGLNDGRFLSFSNWRQVHGTFDAARIDAELPLNFSFTYAFINRFYREDGYNATDGEAAHAHGHDEPEVEKARSDQRVALRIVA